jgi:hypothetical protein
MLQNFFKFSERAGKHALGRICLALLLLTLSFISETISPLGAFFLKKKDQIDALFFFSILGSFSQCVLSLKFELPSLKLVGLNIEEFDRG